MLLFSVKTTLFNVVASLLGIIDSSLQIARVKKGTATQCVYLRRAFSSARNNSLKALRR